MQYGRDNRPALPDRTLGLDCYLLPQYSKISIGKVADCI